MRDAHLGVVAVGPGEAGIHAPEHLCVQSAWLLARLTSQLLRRPRQMGMMFIAVTYPLGTFLEVKDKGTYPRGWEFSTLGMKVST